MNNIALTMEEFWELFDGFSPKNMLINRCTGEIKLDISPQESICVAMISDM